MKNIYFKIIDKLKEKNIKLIDLSWLLIFPIINTNYIIAANIAKTGQNIDVALDGYFKFTPIFIIPYIYWYIFMAIAFGYFLYNDRTDYMRVFIAVVIGMCCCYVVYYIFPTEMTRPTVENSNILNKLINMIYAKDRPLNCFPSIHVLITYFIMRYTNNENKIYFYYTQIVGILIILSTVYIKQHFVLDILGSIILCEGVMFIINKISIENLNKILDLPVDIKNRFVKNDEETVNEIN